MKLTWFERLNRLGSGSAKLAAPLVALALLSACQDQDRLQLASAAPSNDAVVIGSAPTDPQVRPAAFAADGEPSDEIVANIQLASAGAGRETRSRQARNAAAAPRQTQGKTHYVEFRARSAASYGHTFASFGELNPDGSIATTEIVGLHPATDSVLPWMIGHLVPVPSETGASDGDKEEIYFTARYRIRMDQARFEEVKAQIRDLQANSPAWHAVFYNCNAFIGDLARRMGLRAPGNTLLFPKEYIEELATLNGA